MKRVVVPTLIVLAVVIAVYVLANRSYTTGPEPVDYSTALLIKPYENNQFKFSLSMPGDFSARELPPDENSSATILLESSTHADGVQIIVTPFDEEISALTQERIQQDVPDLVITDPQSVEIGANNTGLAFKSNNEAFDGASREVWFVFRRNLYQISTYDRLDPLLKKIFSSWKFL